MDVGIVSALVRNAAAIRDAVTEVGGTPVDCDLSGVDSAGVDVVPTTGDASARQAVEADLTVPLLPIDSSPGLCPVSESEIVAALRSIRNGEADPLVHRAITIEIDGAAPATSIREIALVTDEPATISEFALDACGTRIAEYRADGVVVATAAGSGGYARSVGGPLLAPGTDAVVAITVAPYRIDPDHWILPPDELFVTVTRDESAVVCLVDGHELGPIGIGEPVHITADRDYRTLRVPGGMHPLAARSAREP